ncbi:MAG: hypothetical protein OXG77_06240 [Chloroflexi bacterium]|nr:hypothetical protein [Chloroflexota bacterium]
MLVSGNEVAHAQQQSELSGCFGGLLAPYALHCAVLEGSHNAGEIEIEVIYHQTLDELLFLLAEPAELTEETFRSIRTRAKRVLEDSDWEGCRTQDYDSLGCESGVLRDGRGAALLPPMAEYEELSLWTHSGESSLWVPGAVHVFGVHWDNRPVIAEPNWEESGFDLSELDLANVPAMDCSALHWGLACNYWNRHPELRIAGFWATGDPSLDQVDAYFYVKAPADDDQAALLESAEATLLEAHDFLADDNLTLRPAEFDLGELWHWAHMLNTFAQSPANSIGVWSAFLGSNRSVSDDQAVLPVAGMPHPSDATRSVEHIRDTIVVWTFEIEATVAALPTLLAQLGIPESAVGVIERPPDVTNPVILVPPPDVMPVIDVSPYRPDTYSAPRTGALVLVAAVAVAALFAGTVVLIPRRRRVANLLRATLLRSRPPGRRAKNKSASDSSQ